MNEKEKAKELGIELNDPAIIRNSDIDKERMEAESSEEENEGLEQEPNLTELEADESLDYDKDTF
jgi:hypothetical protein